MSKPWRWNCAELLSAPSESDAFPPQPATTAVAKSAPMRMTPYLNPRRPYDVRARISIGQVTHFTRLAGPLELRAVLPMMRCSESLLPGTTSSRAAGRRARRCVPGRACTRGAGHDRRGRRGLVRLGQLAADRVERPHARAEGGADHAPVASGRVEGAGGLPGHDLPDRRRRL